MLISLVLKSGDRKGAIVPVRGLGRRKRCLLSLLVKCSVSFQPCPPQHSRLYFNGITFLHGLSVTSEQLSSP